MISSPKLLNLLQECAGNGRNSLRIPSKVEDAAMKQNSLEGKIP
jgi:hypothetical protein